MTTIARVAALVLAVMLSVAVGATTAGGEVSVSAMDADEYLPRVAYNPNHDEYLVVWHQNRAVVGPGAANRIIVGRRLDRYGVPLGAAFEISPAVDDRDRAQPDVAFDPAGNRYVVVYLYDYHGNGSDWDVRGRFIDWNGVNPGLPEFDVSAATVSEWNPRVEYATVANKYLVTWWDEFTPPRVRGAFGAFGSPPVGTFTIADHVSEPRVGPDLAYQVLGDTFFVVYSNAVHIYGVLITAAGSLGSELAIAEWPETESSPAVATCTEGQYLVVWQSLIGPDNTEIYARPVWWDGSMAGGPLQVTSYPMHDSSPSVSCSDIHYLVAYESQYNTGLYGIFAREMRAGTFEMQPEVTVRPVYGGETGDPLSTPAVAGGAADWLVVWEHDRQPGTAYQDIHGAAVWQVFGAGFEWGDLWEWSSSSP